LNKKPLFKLELDNVCKTYLCPCRTKINKAENVGHSDLISILMCSTHHDVSMMNNDDCWTYTSREMELNAKSNKSQWSR